MYFTHVHLLKMNILYIEKAGSGDKWEHIWTKGS